MSGGSTRGKDQSENQQIEDQDTETLLNQAGDRRLYRKTKQKEGIVCGIADALRPDDYVYINNRSRPLRVLGRDEDVGTGFIRGNDYPYKIVWLRGNGTEYRLRYSHLGEYYPTVHTEGELKTRETYSPLHDERRKQTIPKSTSQHEHVRRLWVDGIHPSDLTEWSLRRNIDGISVEVDDAE